MGKPLGLLHRIFSFSKSSKRSDPKFDLPRSTNEHGQGINRDNEHEDPLLAAGSIRTTGGIGGLGRGITNAPSEMSHPKPTTKSVEGGMKKRRLRRASLSASNLLSWGQDRAGRITSHGSQEQPESIQGDDTREVGYRRIEPGQYRISERNHGSKECLQMTKQGDEIPRKESLDINGDNCKVKRPSSPHQRGKGDEQFTRLLRSSSANYKVISETDCRALDPIEHPINALAFPRPSFESQPAPPTGPPSAWTPKSQARTLVFPSLNAPSTLMHAPSVASTTSNSTYKVTVHRRRVHSRTSFPEANRALDHLHSSSSTDASNSSPCPSPELQRPSPRRHSVEAMPEEQANDRKQISKLNAKTTPKGDRSILSTRSGTAPSMIPRWSSMGHSDKPRGRTASQIYQPASISQVHPVGPLRTVPPTSQRVAGVESSTIIPVHRELGTKTSEKPHFYTMPLKGIDPSVEEVDGNLSNDGDISFSRSTASKGRNVLRKKRPGSQASLVTVRERSLKKTNSIRSDKSSKKEGESGTKTKLRGSLRNVLNVITAVEGIVDRLHASAVGEASSAKPGDKEATLPQALVTSTPSQPRQFNSAAGNSSEGPTAQVSAKRSSLKVHNWLAKKVAPVEQMDRHVSVLGTPRDKGRLARLRRDPSVASLLDVYEADGTLKRTAFSNTPPTRDSNKGRLAPREKGVAHSKQDGQATLGRDRKDSKGKNSNRSTTSSKSHLMARSGTSFEGPLSSSKYGYQPSRSVDSMGPETPSQEGLQFDLSSSLNVSNEASTQVGMNTSLFVEMGSGGHIESSCDDSSSDVEYKHYGREAARRKLEGISISKSKIPLREGGTKTSSLQSPNRRASEVFAFLDFPQEDADSSFEIGGLEESLGGHQSQLMATSDVEPGLEGAETIPKLGVYLDSRLHASTPLHPLGGSPHKKPMGPRGAREVNPLPPGSNGSVGILARTPSEVLTAKNTQPSPLKLVEANVLADTSSVPLTGATFESDSFASQNTTDRSIYRGIYSYLKEATSNLGQSSKVTSTGTKSSPDIIQETPALDSKNPFLVSSLNIDKALPSTPPNEIKAPFSLPPQALHTPKKEGKNFAPLPPFTPMSPFDAGMATHKFQIPRTPETPSPSKPPNKSTVRDHITRWEGTGPLHIDRERIQRQNSTRRSTAPHLTSAKKSNTRPRGMSSPTHAVQVGNSGLGDGRAFNAANKFSRPQGSKGLHRNNSSGTHTHKPVGAKVAPKGDSLSKTGKSLDLTQAYPFSEDLFPAIFMPSGPTVVKTNNLLQSPQRLPSQHEPSPASSSKLGVYGREIMALARSKLLEDKAI